MNQIKAQNNNQITREQQARAIIQTKLSQINTIVENNKAKASTFASAIVSMANDINLNKCSVESVVNTAMQIVQIGLNPNKLFGQAYVVPYGSNAQLQIGYKGLIALGYRNGWKFRAIAVYSCDEFSQKFCGIKDDITFNPNYDERNETDSNWVFTNLRGVLVYAVDKQGDEFSEFVSKKKLEQLRTTSPNQNSNTLSGTWAKWAEEMYKAKAIKHVATRLPINDSLAEALSIEDEPIRSEAQTINTQPKTKDLNKLLSEQKATEITSQPINNTQADFMQNSPAEVFIDVEADLSPHAKLENELIKRGATQIEAENIVTRYAVEQVSRFLDEPSSIDALLDQV